MTDDEKFLAEVDRIATDGTMLLKLLEMVRERDAETARLKKDLERQIEYCTACVTSAGEENDRLRKALRVAVDALENISCGYGEPKRADAALVALANVDRIR